jgi:hypothetical protein
MRVTRSIATTRGSMKSLAPTTSSSRQFEKTKAEPARQTSNLGNRQIEQLGRTRSAAIAEAKLIYEKEHQERKRTDMAPPARRSGEERQREFWAARLQAVEDGQKAFWEKVARDEPKVAEVRAARWQAIAEQQSAFWAGLPLREAQNTVLMAARRQAVEEAQTAFWAELFERPVTTPLQHKPNFTSDQGARGVEKQANTQAQQKNTRRRSFNTKASLPLPISGYKRAPQTRR